MTLYRFLLDSGFADQGSVRHVREALHKERRSRYRASRVVEERLGTLEEDLGFVTLVLAALLCKLDEQGAVTQADLRSLVAELDDVDGVADGRLDVNLLKELTKE